MINRIISKKQLNQFVISLSSICFIASVNKDYSLYAVQRYSTSAFKFVFWVILEAEKRNSIEHRLFPMFKKNIVLLEWMRLDDLFESYNTIQTFKIENNSNILNVQKVHVKHGCSVH